MHRAFSFIAVAIAGIFPFIFSTHPNTSNIISRTWERVLHKSPAEVLGPYEAPLIGCLPEWDPVPNSYIVFLHSGYSLDHHKETVSDGADFDSAVEYIFDETARHGLYYSAELDDVSLAAIRADIGVNMVECNRRDI